MNDDIRIVGISVRDERPNPDGVRFLAYLDIKARGFAMLGCGLTLRKDGTIRLTLPRVAGGEHRHVAFKIEDPDLDAAMTAAAVNAYRAMRGTAVAAPETPPQT